MRDVSPDTVVATSSLGTPKGSCSNAALASAVFVPPPMARKPRTSFCSCRRSMQAESPRIIVRRAAARSRFRRRSSMSAPASAATSRASMSGLSFGSPRMPQSIRIVSSPWLPSASMRRRVSADFVSNVVAITTAGFSLSVVARSGGWKAIRNSVGFGSLSAHWRVASANRVREEPVNSFARDQRFRGCVCAARLRNAR